MKKIFYKRRFRLPVWMQIYVIWWVAVIITVPLIFYWGTYEAGDFDSRKKIIQNPVFNTETVKNKLQYVEQNLYPGTVFSTTALQNGKTALGIGKWIVETRTQKQHDIKCSYTSVYKPGTNHQNIVLGIPIENHGEIAKAAMITMASLNNIETKASIYYLFYSDHYRCFEGFNLVANIPGLTATANYIFYSKRNSADSGVAINGTMRNVSSTNWQFALPSFTIIPGFLKQLGVTLSPVFQGPEGALLSLNESAIGFFYANSPEDVNTTIQMATDMRRTIQYFENNGNNEIENLSFWVSPNRVLTRNGFRILLLLLVILIWFPFFNKRYNSNDRLEIPRGLFAVVYYMLVPLFFFIGLKLTYDIGHASNYIIPSLILASLALLFVFNRLEKNTLNFNTNPTTGIFVMNIIFTITSILQPIIFILLIPVIFSLSQAVKRNGIVKIIWFLFGFIPMGFILYISAPEEHQNVLLEASFYLTTFFNGFFSIISSLLLVGGMVSVLRIKKKRR
ncbi:MAG: hypothetical protein ABUK01_01630 [Leptospirales bacterium]